MNRNHRIGNTGFLGLLSALALTLAVCGCGGSTPSQTDAGSDAGHDGGLPECITDAQCDDGNVCTDDHCQNGTCLHTNNSLPCDDGKACTNNDHCQDGVCSGGAPVQCDDHNPCTTDGCDDKGGCTHVNNTLPCDDGNACNTGERCQDGQCQGGSAVACDDGNICTDDSCDPAHGCVHTNNTIACDDHQACSTNDHCSNGVCVGDSNRNCDDNNPCTEDSCDDALGCVHAFNHAPCDDHNACTTGDVCASGICKGGTQVTCDDDNPCTTDSCDTVSGCVYTNNTIACDDNDACTVGDVCQGGACKPGTTKNCNDSNPCTDDSCDKTLGCVHTNNTAACDDNDACTVGDVCQGGACKPGTTKDCNDTNPCTTDSCDTVLGCVHTNNTSACDDGNACTVGDVCQGGACKPGTTKNCNDNNPCTDDSCDRTLGCVNTPNTLACNDNDACTMNDTCSGGTCRGVPLDADHDGYVAVACGGNDCNDSDPNVNPGVVEGPYGSLNCSDGIDNDCDGNTDMGDTGCHQCTTDPDCDDHNVCNGTEKCVGGVCQSGTSLNCDDGNVCTTDTCDKTSGCQHSNNTLACNDGNACTSGDHCQGGSCTGTAITCNDNNPCTDDSCNTSSGCVYTNNTSSCDDGNACTTGDHCSGGSCLAGTGVVCNDNNPCTTDSCNPASGCVYSNNTLACDDGNACTTGDHCSGGSCVAGTGVVCNDNNPCTTDSCNPASGCVYNNNSNTCDDGSACTTGDHCSGGACVGSAVSCDDGNVCTTDSCDTSTGCVHTPNSNACNDGNACTTGDQCSGGVCTGVIRDQDGDHYPDKLCGGTDCNDLDVNINPGRPEVCGNGIDDNCNDIIDEGCATCSTIDPTAERQIDNDNGFSSFLMAASDVALNAFIVDSTSYNVLAVKAAFFDFACGTGTDSGRYSAHIFADNSGKPGTELGSSAIVTINKVGTCTTGGQQAAWQVFNLTVPVSFTHGQIFWVGVRSEDDESTDQFLPFADGGILDPYAGGVIYTTPPSQPRDYYSTGGLNWMIRAQGCAEGPWLTLASHTQMPAIVPAGQPATIVAGLHNRGYANSASVSGTISSDRPEFVITTANATYGVINIGATANNNPNFGVQPTSAAFGIYAVALASTDGPHAWNDGFGVYVQGTGCTQDNKTLQTDDNTPTYVVPEHANDEVGNYFVVDSASFALRSVDVSFAKNVANPASSRFRLKVYTYLAGYPDQQLFQGAWQAVSGSGQFVVNFPVSPALTFKNGDTFWVTIQSESDLTNLGTNNYFAVLADDGNGNATPASWYNGVVKTVSDGKWSPWYISMIMRPKGCAATELRYSSHTTNPSPVPKGSLASITVTIANDGAIAANGVTGTLTSGSADVTVTDNSAAFGVVPANGTKTATDPFQVSVAAGASQFQYIMQLDLTDGVTVWRSYFPLVLQGAYIDLAIQNFTATLAGSDIQWHWEVVNNGNIDCYTPFQVDLYVNRDTAPPAGVNGDWSDNPQGILRGQPIPYDLAYPSAPQGTYKSWVQVDTTQLVTEQNEGNNVAGPQTVTIGNDAFVLLNPARKWFPAQMPVHYRFASGTQPGMPAGQDKQAVRNGFQHWQDVTPATITFQEDGQTGPAGYIEDGFNTITFNDPTGDVPSGAIAATLPIYDSQTMVTNGTTFYRMIDADLVFNNGMPFGTNAQAAAPTCQQSPLFDMEGVATHELGHLLGLDHAPQINATMYYAVDYCDPSKVTLETPDTNGCNFIYP